MNGATSHVPVILNVFLEPPWSDLIFIMTLVLVYGIMKWFSTLRLNLNFCNLTVYTTLPLSLWVSPPSRRSEELCNFHSGRQGGGWSLGKEKEEKWTPALITSVIVKKSVFKQWGKTGVERNTEGLDRGPPVLFDLRSNLFFFKQIGEMFGALLKRQVKV